MRIVEIKELQSGDVLAKAVETKNGTVMLGAGTVLTEQYINRLKTIRVQSVYLKRPMDSRLLGGDDRGRSASEDLLWLSPDIDRLKNDDKAREEAVKRVKDFAEISLFQEQIVLPIAEGKFREQFRDIVTEITSQKALAEELGVMMLTDSLLFEQALHVTVSSIILGTAQGFDSSKLYDLSVGAMFCDIGMTRLPTDLTKINRVLNESELAIMRQHTNEGFRVLKSMKEVPATSAPCALLHHERYRGSGYPLAVSQESIPEFAQIVGIADVYNALISPRHHRNSYESGEALEYLFASGNYEFDISLVQVFLQNLTIYPVFSLVKLSSGQIARVMETAGRPIQRPVVEVFCESNGLVVKSPYVLDLQEHPHIVIVGKADK
jgi:HD-GYP domain-containing protein (c-di-GMP phosphodiesterase class II)